MSTIAVPRPLAAPGTSAGIAGAAIRTERLTKRYGKRAVVDGLTISIPRGSIAIPS